MQFCLVPKHICAAMDTCALYEELVSQHRIRQKVSRRQCWLAVKLICTGNLQFEQTQPSPFKEIASSRSFDMRESCNISQSCTCCCCCYANPC
jgi:hypothetical protein